MTFLELVNKRCSVRKYDPSPVPREIIDRCLEAARLAPSACNSQPWRFVVVDDAALRRKLAEAAFSGVYSMNSFAKEAPVLVVAVRERSTRFAAFGALFRGLQYNLIDIGIACEHFILQAASEDVGTCWLGWFDEGAVKKVLGIEKGKKADIIISMGYPQKGTCPEKARMPLSEISGYNPRPLEKIKLFLK